MTDSKSIFKLDVAIWFVTSNCWCLLLTKFNTLKLICASVGFLLIGDYHSFCLLCKRFINIVTVNSLYFYTLLMIRFEKNTYEIFYWLIYYAKNCSKKWSTFTFIMWACGRVCVAVDFVLNRQKIKFYIFRL